ncbi:ATP-binding cassette domain-containing protein [Alteromonas sp. H39]|uniref:ATP-binding cassette domain-containing protein n=1 Tax=Alteromonas sp. H39 TaxID=3389876 RepID=UPI0039E1F9A6
MSENALLHVNNLSVVKADRTLLNNIRGTFAPGEFVAIIGENGCGKSSLLSELSGADANASSKVHFHGRPLQHYRMSELANFRAVMQQTPTTPFGFLSAEVLELARNQITESPAQRQSCIELVAKWFEISHLLTRNIQSLSGGECQRVFLAKTVLQILPSAQIRQQELNGRVLLLDEPTSALDLRHQKIVMQTLVRLCQAGLCILCVSHDINLITPYASRMMILGEKRCLADASPAEALNQDVLRRCFHTQLQLLKNEHQTVFVTH